MNHPIWVLETLRENELFLKALKCTFYSQQVNYIGLIIMPVGMEPEEGKTEAIRTWPTPTDPTKARKWLSFAGFYRRFIPEFSKLMKPITDLTRKDARWVWMDECQRNFDELKRRLCSGPVLVHADPTKQYFLETDALGTAIRAVLSQKDSEGRRWPIAYMSQGLTAPQLNYDTHDKELLAAVEALKKWWIYLEGTEKPVIILTDHRNLLYWKDAHNHNRRHNRWYHKLGPYKFEIHYRPGKVSVRS